MSGNGERLHRLKVSHKNYFNLMGWGELKRPLFFIHEEIWQDKKKLKLYNTKKHTRTT